MKYLLLTVILAFALDFASAQEPAQKAQLAFEKMNHDFGILKYRGGVATAEFKFTNTGTAPLVIIRTELSCTCLDSYFPKKPIAPGESGVLTVTYKPTKDLGVFKNTVKVFSNAESRMLILFVEGEVVRR